jgi:hypothetical protein
MATTKSTEDQLSKEKTMAKLVQVASLDKGKPIFVNPDQVCFIVSKPPNSQIVFSNGEKVDVGPGVLDLYSAFNK